MPVSLRSEADHEALWQELQALDLPVGALSGSCGSTLPKRIQKQAVGRWVVQASQKADEADLSCLANGCLLRMHLDDGRVDLSIPLNDGAIDRSGLSCLWSD